MAAINLKNKVILLVEDNPDDEALTLRALGKSNLLNDIVVARDGVEAWEYLTGTGAYANRDKTIMPQVILLDLKVPKLDGLGLLRKIRETELTRLLPVVVLTSSNEEQDRMESYKLGANSYVRKPVDFTQFMDAASQLGLYWLVLNEPPPIRRGK
jgi:two-component system response regulator